MRVSLIVAVSQNGVIGKDGTLPWHLATDLKRFKKLTMGHTIVMGRKTYESVGRLLPGRSTVVLSSRELPIVGARVSQSLRDAISQVADEEVFIVGGARVYAEAMPIADRIYLTEVQAEVEGDTYFPAIETSRWKVVFAESFAADDRNDFPHRFQILDRRPASDYIR